MIRPEVVRGLVLAIALAGAQACGLPPARATQAFVYQCQLHPAEAGVIARRPAFADRYFPGCHSLQGLA
jgi:hypothetical protein